MKLSIIIPVYNEEKTILEMIKRVQAVNFNEAIEKEIIIIDDGSKDNTREFLRQIIDPRIRVVLKEKNEGKGSAVRIGLQQATGDIILIQDADLEYNPQEYHKLLQPILCGDADVVYGSRMIGSEARRVLFFWHYLGNKFLTTFSNLFTNLNLTDMETCYKVFTREVVDGIKEKLRAKRFGIEPEITAYVSKGKWRIYEVGIAYNGRTYEEGKKVNWKDGVAAIWYIIKYNLFKRL